MRIGELAERLGLNTQTIRYYERIGLLPEPERTDSGYRLYDEEDERRLRFVRNARGMGLRLGEIGEALALRERGEPPCAYVAEVISRRVEEIERRIAELTKFKAELDGLREVAGAHPVRDPEPGGYCHIIESNEAAWAR